MKQAHPLTFLIPWIAPFACAEAEDADPATDTESVHASADDDAGPDDGADDDGGDASTTAPPATTTDATDATDATGESGGGVADCTDQMILDLGLVEGAVSSGTVTEVADGIGYVASVDATAGGIMAAPTQPWLYLKFTDTGLAKVELDDLQALTSADWDIAAKRFGLRLNSGVSGPSSVTAAAVPDQAYEDLESLPDVARLRAEAYYDEGCALVDDGTGQGAPDYVLTPWWFYPGCVGTTLTPFVLELADGRHVKFVVDAYYAQGQDACNASGAMGTGSAQYTWRWAPLP